MVLRDDVLGPLYLVFQEVIEPDEEAATIMLDYHSELMWSGMRVSVSPTWAGRRFAHLRRGETKRFLKTYYNTLASLADRQTYSFWEHYYHERPHKTAELAQFLMQTPVHALSGRSPNAQAVTGRAVGHGSKMVRRSS
jgi:hypothetical protein